MSTFLPLTWPIVDTQAVCKPSSTPQTQLALDGTLASISIPNQVSFIANDMIRSISITGTGMSGVNFIVTGFQNGALVTESIPGPASGSVYGTKYYDIIESITTNTAVTNVSVGTGTSGYLPLIVVNPNTTAINYSFSVSLNLPSSVNYTMFQTLASINTNFIPFSNQTSLFPVPGVENITVKSINNSTAITNFLLLKINSSVATDSFDFTFLQE
jgi:hypothetical protein